MTDRSISYPEALVQPWGLLLSRSLIATYIIYVAEHPRGRRESLLLYGKGGITTTRRQEEVYHPIL